MSRIFTCHICKCHDDIFAVLDVEYLKGKCGDNCSWEYDVGEIHLDANNKLVVYYLNNWVYINIEFGIYNFAKDSALHNIYDENNEIVNIVHVSLPNKRIR